MYITQQFPDAPLLGLGFSLGANVLTRYLGEEGINSKIHSGCVLACVRFFLEAKGIPFTELLSSLGISDKIIVGTHSGWAIVN